MEFLNYHHLRYFWVVAKEGGLRKAADKLHVSQPTISAQLAAGQTLAGLKVAGRWVDVRDPEVLAALQE